MKHYPKAQGLMAAWIRLQAHRDDLVGQFARTVNQAGSAAPIRAFRVVVWRRWALANGLTDAHVEAFLSEYARVSMADKRAAYDASRAQCVRCVLQLAGLLIREFNFPRKPRYCRTHRTHCARLNRSTQIGKGQTMNQHVDGDDYTWNDGASQAGPVFNIPASAHSVAASAWLAVGQGQPTPPDGNDSPGWLDGATMDLAARQFERVNAPKPGAAAAFAELREKFGAHFDAIEDVDAWVKAQRRGVDSPLELPAELAADGWQLHQAAPDLRTADQRERDDVAALRADLAALAETVRLKIGPVDVDLRVDNLVDVMEGLGRRLAAVERSVAALVKVLEVRLP